MPGYAILILICSRLGEGMEHVLLVEDDAHLRDGLTELLTREGMRVTAAATASQADRLMAQEAFDLAVLDVGLPDDDGVSLCRRWRDRGQALPVLFLTARDEEMDVVRGLEGGGDDYVAKPFRMLELLSRIRALLRRGQSQPRQVAGLHIDADRMTVTVHDEQVFLTPTEYRILTTLARGAGRIITRGMLLQQIWDEGGQYIDDNTLSVHVSRLREKIGAHRIRTVRGVGYQWEE